MISSLYADLLHRSPDPAGLESGLSHLGRRAIPGVDRVGELATSILGSAEYYQRHANGTTAVFLATLYTDVLHRPIDAAGSTTWTPALARGTLRTAVARALLGSREAEQVLVRGYYQQFLGRAADATGLKYFVDVLMTGARRDDVIAALVVSDEFFRRP